MVKLTEEELKTWEGLSLPRPEDRDCDNCKWWIGLKCKHPNRDHYGCNPMGYDSIGHFGGFNKGSFWEWNNETD